MYLLVASQSDKVPPPERKRPTLEPHGYWRRSGVEKIGKGGAEAVEEGRKRV